MPARAHLYLPVTDADGNVLTDLEARILQPGTLAAFPFAVFAAAIGSSVVAQPFLVPDGIIDVYFTSPARVRVGVTPPGQSEFFIEDVDVMPAGSSAVSAAQSFEVTNTPTGPGEVLASVNSSLASWSTQVPLPEGSLLISENGDGTVTLTTVGGSVVVTDNGDGTVTIS